MSSPVKLLKVIRYDNDLHWDSQPIMNPSWNMVEEAIRQMDDYYFPFVLLSCSGYNDADDNFEIIGGNGEYTMLQHLGGTWEYDDPTGSDQEVQLWKSDQGHFCQDRNICRDIEHVLRIVKTYFETGSYDGLNDIA